MKLHERKDWRTCGNCVIPRVLSFFQFDCPRCGKALGIVAKGSCKAGDV